MYSEERHLNLLGTDAIWDITHQIWDFELQYCAKVTRAKFVLCSHEFSRKFAKANETLMKREFERVKYQSTFTEPKGNIK